MRRREFITLLGGVAAAWPVKARAQRPPFPVIGLIASGAAAPRNSAAFSAGLKENGYIDGQNVSIEYHWLEGQFEQLPALLNDMVRRRVALIATPASVAGALAAKAATSTIPIVFGVNNNPVTLGLVTNFPRPGGNLTGMNFLAQEAVPKRLELFHELLPRANRIALLVNSNNSAEASATTLREAQVAAQTMGLSIESFKAGNNKEIETAFATIGRERIDAIFIAGDAFFGSRVVQLVTLATRYGIATSSPNREFVEAGGLMSYGTSTTEVWHQVGAYAGQILNGAKPADLPVVQSTRFEFVINVQTARALGIDPPANLLATADEVIE